MTAAAVTPTVPTTDAREENPWARAWRRLKRRKGAMFGLVVVVLFVLVAILAPLISPYDPIATSFTQVRKPPSWAHWLGTDEVGRDVLARIIWGAWASLSAGVVSVGIALGIGVPLGLLAGYAGGWIDAVLSRVVDAMLAIPFLILAIALAAFLGPSLTNAMIAIGVTATPVFIRLTRGQTLAAKVEDYVEAARAVGNPHWRIALRHVLPNIVPPLLVQASLAIAGAIISRVCFKTDSSPPGTGPAAAGTFVGQHAELRAALHRASAMDGLLAGLRDLLRGPVVQPAGRRPAGCPGPSPQVGGEGLSSATTYPPRRRPERRW